MDPYLVYLFVILIFKAGLERKSKKENVETEKSLAYKVENLLKSSDPTLPRVGIYKGMGC